MPRRPTATRWSLLLAIPWLLGAAPAASAPADPTALVVLVHGMGRTSLSMLPLQWSLERAGYRVLNFHYSSYGPGVAEIGADLARRLRAELDEHPAERVHFVGHSLGNIVVRWLLAHHPPPAEVGRLVMLAPPNQGSRVADRLTPYVGWILTPIGELRTEGSTAVRVPPPHAVEFAIVAGRQDGKVSVAETCLPRAAAHVVVPFGHTFIMLHPSVHRLVESFLATGALPPGEASGPAHCP